MMRKYIIWDWNGTLLDDVSAAVRALNRMLARRGVPAITEERYRMSFGFPVRPFYSELGVDLDQWDWNAICEDFHSFVAEEPQKVRDDAQATLESARALGFRQCILSALREDLLERALAANGLRGFFDFVFGVDNLDGASKLRRGEELIAAMGVAAGNVVLVGDTLHDAEVAKSLGAGCVLVSIGHQAPGRLSAAGCQVVGSLGEAVAEAARLFGAAQEDAAAR